MTNRDSFPGHRLLEAEHGLSVEWRVLVGLTDQLVNRRVATQFSWRGRSFCIERTLLMDIMDTIEWIDIDIR